MFDEIKAIRVPDEKHMTRLPTHIWADALIRRVNIGGASAFVTQKGDKDRGDVLIKIARLDGRAAYLVRSPMSFDELQFDWLPTPGAWAEEREVDEALSRRRGYDPDLWIIEIEDPAGRHFLTETVNGECKSPDMGPNP